MDYYIDVINESTSVTSRVYDFQNQGQAKPFRKVHGQPKGNEVTDMIEIDRLFAEVSTIRRKIRLAHPSPHNLARSPRVITPSA